MASTDRTSAPKPQQGKSGPDDKGGGTTHRPHPNTGKNR